MPIMTFESALEMALIFSAAREENWIVIPVNASLLKEWVALKVDQSLEDVETFWEIGVHCGTLFRDDFPQIAAIRSRR
jgi:hypothetical protein